MSASLVRKALDETKLASEEKLDNLSTASKKRFKPQKKVKKLSKEKLLKQNLKVLKALEYKVPVRSKTKEDPKPAPVLKQAKNKGQKKKNGSNNKTARESGFTDEDFEKFEKEYFVSA